MAATPMNVKRHSGAGQALVEFALIIPLALLLIVNVVNFGGLLYAWVTVSNASRAGVQYMMMGSSTIHSPISPTAAQVSALVTADLLSLPNRDSAVVQVCTNNNGTSSCSPLPPGDPEPTLYCLGAVDVTYTYKPFIRIWSFTGLGIGLPTILGATDIPIHRKAVMRLGGGC
jgi:hypothetical protein